MLGTRKSAAVVAAAMLAVGVIGFGGINSYLPGGGDNAGYIAEAESLLQCGRRRSLYEAGSPPATLKAPLFPVMLAGVETLFGRNIAAMKALLVLFAMGSVWAAWWALRWALREGEEDRPSAGPAGAPEDVTSFQAAMLALWFALMPILALTCHDVLTDVPFTFLALLVIGFTSRVARPAATWRVLALLAAVLTVATFVRFAGVLLSAACASYLGLEALLRRKEKCFTRLLLSCLVVAAIGAAFVWQQRSGEQSSVRFVIDAFTAPAKKAEQSAAEPQTESAPQRSLRAARFFAFFLAAEAGAYDGLAPRWAAYALLFTGCGVAAVGAVALLRRGKRLIPVCVAAYLVFFVVVSWLDRRYYLPVLPLWLCLLWVGAARVFTWARARGRWVAALTVFGLGIFPATGMFGTLLLFGSSEVEPTTAVEWAAAAAFFGGLVVYVGRSSGSPGDPADRPARDPLWQILAGVFLVLAVCRGVSENVVRERRAGPAPSATGWADLYDAACWLKQNAQPGEAVVSDRNSLVWFWSGLQGVRIPRSTDPAQVAQRLQPAQWAILDGLREDLIAARFLRPFVATQKGMWEVRWHQGETWILRRKNAPPRP